MDGLPAEFYSVFYNLIKDNLLDLIKNSLESGDLPECAKTGAIILIPKKGDKKNLNHWRPISLSCADYKILAKVLSNRFAPVLNTIINHHQTGALPGRSITDNHSAFRNAICNDASPGAIVSLDFQKAFDRVDREKIYIALHFFKFSPTFITWIRTLYEDSNARIIINVQQGCPLAALLYLTYVEPLQLMLQKETIGMRVGSNIIFSTVFIDDVSIFVATDFDFYTIKNILSLFESTSNSRLNKNKALESLT